MPTVSVFLCWNWLVNLCGLWKPQKNLRLGNGNREGGGFFMGGGDGCDTTGIYGILSEMEETNVGQAIPRHNEIKEITARRIIKAFS
jgi:hypothetical protein